MSSPSLIVVIGVFTLAAALINLKKLHQPAMKFSLGRGNVIQGIPTKILFEYQNNSPNATSLTIDGNIKFGNNNVLAFSFKRPFIVSGEDYVPLPFLYELRKRGIIDLSGPAEKYPAYVKETLLKPLRVNVNYSYVAFHLLNITETYQYEWSKDYKKWIISSRDYKRRLQIRNSGSSHPIDRIYSA